MQGADVTDRYDPCVDLAGCEALRLTRSLCYSEGRTLLLSCGEDQKLIQWNCQPVLDTPKVNGGEAKTGTESKAQSDAGAQSEAEAKKEEKKKPQPEPEPEPELLRCRE